MPSGIIEIVFNLTDGHFIPISLNNHEQCLPRVFINGFNTKIIHLQLPPHLVFFGVRLYPLTVKQLFRTPACEFSDIAVDLTILEPRVDDIWEQLVNENDFNRRVAIVCNWLASKHSVGCSREQSINEFLSSTQHHDRSVSQLAESFCYSPRQFSRKVKEATGLNAEDVLLYRKYLHSLDLMHHAGLSLTEIAHQCSFFDQSHFIRSFKSFTTLTPGEYIRNKSFLKGHLFEDVR